MGKWQSREVVFVWASGKVGIQSFLPVINKKHLILGERCAIM